MTIHPDRPPNQPYFRGVSDLPGEFGDLFYGPYERSTNHYVKSGSAARKRDGYVRAFDESFEGSASVLYHRDGATRALVVADGEGVKVLASLPPSFYPGVSAANSGFANDPFTRANSGTINAQDYPWIEGKTSDEAAGRVIGSDFEIDTNALQLDSAVGVFSGLDWSNRAPSVFHGYRIEVDLSNLNLTGTGNKMELRFFLGLPDIYTLDGGLSVGRYRQYAVDASTTWNNSYPGGMGQDTCWQGVVCVMDVEQDANGKWRIGLRNTDYLSSKLTSSNAARQGRLAPINENSFLSTKAAAQTNWVIEFGRRQISGSSWKTEARLWKEKTIADIESGAATGSNETLRLTSGVNNLDANVGVFYRSLSKDGSGGYFGMICSFNQASRGSVEIPEIKATISLV